ncbi:MAG: hypothetical protein KY431_01060 [Actinobacteria bacterium]|nr:hypothetical protein [Actinomycetota bacterium]
MRMKRLLGAATAAAVIAAGPLSAAASAEEPTAALPTGVGSGLVRSTLLGVDVGNLVNLDILDDESFSTIDPVNGQPVSSAVLNPLKLTSSVLGPLSLGSVATSTTGAEDRKTVNTNTAGNIPLPVVNGLLNGTLSSIVDGDGARSSLLAGVGGGGLDVVGGLLDLGKSPEAMTFTTNAAPARAQGLRGLNIPSLELLNLGALLEGLGLPLGDLPLTDLTGLLEGLGVDSVPVAGEDMPTGDIVDTVAELVEGLDVLESVPADDLDLPLTGELCGTLEGAVGGVLGGVLGGGMGNTEDCTTALDAEGEIPVVGELLDNVDGLLEGILGGVLPTLDGLNLLEARDIKAGMVATATDSVDSSVADVVASIGSLEVANLDVLNDIDLTEDVDVLTGLGDTVTNLLNTGLGFGDLLDVDLLEIEELVAPDGDYTKALSSLTALGVGIKPLGLVGIAQAGSGGPTARGILGSDLPVLGGDMVNLENVLGGATSILTEGVDIQVGQLASEGFFTPVAALTPTPVDPPAKVVTTPDGKLPRTGGGSTLPAALAVLLASTAVVIRRAVRPEKVER